MASESSAQPSADARKLAQVVMQRIAKVKNQVLAEAIGKDESTVCRIVSGETGVKVADLQAFFATLGLKVVDANQHCVPREEFEAYRVLAKAHVNAPQLDWSAE